MRSSLYLFAAGKLAAGLIGIAWLLLLVRVLDVASYGGYIVLMALLEIVLLVSNAGVYAFAQRYITEARLPHNLQLLPRLVWQSLAYRIFTLLLAGGFAILLAKSIASAVNQPGLVHVLAIYAFVFVFEGASRYLELVFESLLEQGRAQLCAVLRNGSRMAGVSVFWAMGSHIDLAFVVKVEAVTSGLGLLLAVVVMAQGLTISQRQTSTQTQRPDSFALDRLAPFALPLYAAQCLTQLYSPDMVKLIVSRVLGIAEAATFGFAQAIIYILQRYLPAALLIGLVRPMLVARRAKTGNDHELLVAGNLILKVNLALLLPLAALFAVAGREFASVASGGKYADAGPLLFLLSLLLVLMGTHVVLSMLATALEDRRAVLIGTLVSVPGVVIGAALAPKLGTVAMVLGLWLSELLWCSFTIWMLRSRGFAFRIDILGWAKLFLAAIIAAGTAALVKHESSLGSVSSLLVCAAVIGITYLASCILLRPLSLQERGTMARMLPARFLR